jgi:uncharacterized membrane protein YfcA
MQAHAPAIFVYVVYLATGAAAGLMSGLFGIGGGLIMVPALLACFAVAGLPPAAVPALALGTSLTAICFTSALASREHFRIGNLKCPFSRRMLGLVGFLAAGVVAGAGISTHLPRNAVLLCIAVFEIGVAGWMLFMSFRPAAGAGRVDGATGLPQERLDTRWSGAFLALTGAVSSIGGIGGATLMIPYFAKAGIEYPKAAALSTFFGSVIGGFGFFSYALLAHPATRIPMSIGYVSLPAFASMALGSYFLVRYGARLSTRLSKVALTRGFCCFLLASGGKVLVPLAVAAIVAH